MEEIRSILHDRLFGQRKSPANPSLEMELPGWTLRAALLKCATLTEVEVEEYIAYEFEGISYETVPLDYELLHPDAEVEGLYADGILQEKILRRHTNQISPETLAKVQRVLPLICLCSHGLDTS